MSEHDHAIARALGEAMRRRSFIALLAGAAATWPNFVAAQPSAKRALVAMLVSGSSVGYSKFVEAFRQGLLRLGYIEGRDLQIAYRYADGDPARLPALAAELVKLKPDVIVTASTSAAVAAKQATTTIPIVSAILTDSIGNGLAVSVAHPGGNVTGIEFTLEGLAGKQFELARKVLPTTSSVGLLVHMKNPSNPPQRRDAETAAAVLGIRLVPVDVDLPDQLDTAFQACARERVDWVAVLADSLFISERNRIAALAISLQLPTIFNFREQVEAGGLISYGIDQPANYQRAADFVDKILKGAKAGELPIEFPAKLQLVINLKTAKAIGLDVPLQLQQLADEVIE
jgi:putative tryptophan/tyrosine transport system substrate-binding protein